MISGGLWPTTHSGCRQINRQPQDNVSQQIKLIMKHEFGLLLQTVAYIIKYLVNNRAPWSRVVGASFCSSCSVPTSVSHISDHVWTTWTRCYTLIIIQLYWRWAEESYVVLFCSCRCRKLHGSNFCKGHSAGVYFRRLCGRQLSVCGASRRLRGRYCVFLGQFLAPSVAKKPNIFDRESAHLQPRCWGHRNIFLWQEVGTSPAVFVVTNPGVF